MAQALGGVGIIRHHRTTGLLEREAGGIGGWEIYRTDGGEPLCRSVEQTGGQPLGGTDLLQGDEGLCGSFAGCESLLSQYGLLLAS